MTRSLEEELADLIIHNNAGPVSLREVGVGGCQCGRCYAGWSGVDSSLHVDNFLFLSLGGRLSFSFNCFCSELQCPLFKLQLLSTPPINPPPTQDCSQTSKQQGCPFPWYSADARLNVATLLSHTCTYCVTCKGWKYTSKKKRFWRCKLHNLLCLTGGRSFIMQECIRVVYLPIFYILCWMFLLTSSYLTWLRVLLAATRPQSQRKTLQIQSNHRLWTESTFVCKLRLVFLSPTPPPLRSLASPSSLPLAEDVIKSKSRQVITLYNRRDWHFQNHFHVDGNDIA